MAVGTPALAVRPVDSAVGIPALVVAPVAAVVPIVTGELGEKDCGTGFVNTYMPWADTKMISYLGWTWDTWNCSSGPALCCSR